ncbi:MAG: ABC transporter substrate-binding protein [Candidatus Magnetomorum sp.]|nr:ABC transporter substrate-binding protein [Candidatus Magnetomorum sp.]
MKQFILNKGLLIILIVILFIGILLLLSVFDIYHSDQDVCLFGVAGPFSGADEEYGKEMLRGIDLCIEKINANGGIDGKKLKYIYKDDMNKTNLAMKVANSFSRNDHLLFVIGHYSSAASFSAGQVYLKEGIPAITASAPATNVTLNNEWYFRSIPSSLHQATFLAMFSKQYCKWSPVTIIASKDIYSRDIKNTYMNFFKNNGIKIENTIDIDEEKNIYPQLQTIVRMFKTSKAKSSVFIATSDRLAVQIIEKLNAFDPHFFITNGHVFSYESFQNELRTIALEKSIPGYYSDGVFTTANDIFANYLFNSQSVDFFKAYYEKYRNVPSSIATNYYDATLLMADILRKMEIDPTARSYQYRRQIKNFLTDIKKPDYAFKGICGDIFFDDNGNAIKNTGLGHYQKGVLVPFHQQFLMDMKSKLNHTNPYESDIQHVSIVQVKTEIVELDIKESFFTAHFFLTFLYDTPVIDPADICFLNATTPVVLDDPVESGTLDGVLYKKYSIKGSFKINFLYHTYPFDKQKLGIHFYHNTLKSNEMRYINKEISLNDNDRFNLSNWKLNRCYAYGMTTQPKVDYSQFNQEHNPDYRIQILIHRDSFHQWLRCFVPGCIIMGLLSCLLFIIPSHTLIAMFAHLSCLGVVSFLYYFLSEISVDYLIPFDHWFILLYLMTGLSFVLTLIIAGLNRKGFCQAIPRVKCTGLFLSLFMIAGYFYYFYSIVVN